jgi:hypothetical protein
MRKTKSNNNESFTGIRKLSNLMNKSSKKTSKKTNKKKKDKEEEDMLKILNSESSINNMSYYNKNKNNNNNNNSNYNYNNNNSNSNSNYNNVDMTLVNDFVPIDGSGRINIQNRIADLLGPISSLNSVPQINNNMMEMNNQNLQQMPIENVMSEVDMNSFNNKMNLLSPVNPMMNNFNPMMNNFNQMMNNSNQMMNNSNQMMNNSNQMNSLSPVNTMMNNFNQDLSPVNMINNFNPMMNVNAMGRGGNNQFQVDMPQEVFGNNSIPLGNNLNKLNINNLSSLHSVSKLI